MTFNGRQYTKARYTKSGGTSWRCVNRKTCPGTLLTHGACIVKEKTHTCQQNDTSIEIKKGLAVCKRRAAMEPDVSIYDIYNDFINALEQKNVNLKKQAPSFESVRKTLYRYRKKTPETETIHYTNFILKQ